MDGEKHDVTLFDSFCYLGDTFKSPEGGAGEAVSARVRGAWNKFREGRKELVLLDIVLRVQA